MSQLRSNIYVMSRGLFGDYQRMFRSQGITQKQDEILKLLQAAYAEHDNDQYSAGLDLAMSIVEGLTNESI